LEQTRSEPVIARLWRVVYSPWRVSLASLARRAA